MSISTFYEAKNIFITGATGFIGKVCLVKIMASLGNCGQVFVMLRPKRGLDPQQRLAKMLAEEPFVPPKNFRPGEEVDPSRQYAYDVAKIDWSKLVAVEGDMSKANLGLDDAMLATLSKSVHIVFNIAASVQFDAPLKQNLRDNYMGTRNLLKLATQFEQLASFVHVSTFYSNSHITHVEEKILPMKRDHEKMAELIEWTPDEWLDSAVATDPNFMDDRPNTYIFTKAMAENLVMSYQGKLPIGIVRPSIVTPALKEPAPGWVDNVNGPMGLGTLASLGILRNIDWNYWGVCDLIPVDYVVNTMLAVAAKTATKHPNEIKVYNCSSSSLNPLTWGQLFEVLREEGFKNPPYKMLRVPIDVPRHKRANKLMFRMTKLSELLFAYFVDFLLMIFGQKQLLKRLTAKLHHGYSILRPFTTVEYTCDNHNLIEAFESLSDADKREFDFDVRKLDWQGNIKVGFFGARRLLLKEELTNSAASLVKFRVLKAVELLFKLLLLALVGYVCLRLFAGTRTTISV